MTLAPWLIAFNALCVALLAQPATALDWKAVAVLSAGQVADGVTTSRFTLGPTGVGCQESNPAYRGPRGLPDMPQVWAGKLTNIGIGVGVGWFAEHVPAKPKVRQVLKALASGVAYGGGALGAYDAVRNVHLCGW